VLGACSAGIVLLCGCIEDSPTFKMDSGIKTERTPLSRSQVQNSAQSHALRRKSYLVWPEWISVLGFFLSDILVRLRIICAEVRSCRGRIGALLERKKKSKDWYLILDLGSMYEAAPSGHLELCSEPLARNAGIAKISLKYPWVSAGDALLFLEGWEMAGQYARNTSDTLRKETAQSSTDDPAIATE